MIVKDLIKKLKKCNKDAVIKIHYGDKEDIVRDIYYDGDIENIFVVSNVEDVAEDKGLTVEESNNQLKDHVYVVVDYDSVAKYCIRGIWFDKTKAEEFARNAKSLNGNIVIENWPIEDCLVNELDLF